MKFHSFDKTSVNDSKSQRYIDAVSVRSHWIKPAMALFVIVIVVLFVADRLFNPQAFQIKEIEVYGDFNHVDGAQVKQVIEATLEGNYFSVSLRRLENEIKKIPWVFSASLRRKWPATIAVYVTEVQPVARWGDDRWFNFTGDLVNRYQGNHRGHEDGEDQESGEDLPLLSAADEQKHIVWEAFRQWSERFASSGISLEALRLDSRDLWWLKLSLGALASNGNQSVPHSQEQGKIIARPLQVTMVVDRKHSFSRIQRFIEALNQELIVQFPQMNTIDLRYPNGFAISWHRSQAIAQHIAKAESDK